MADDVITINPDETSAINATVGTDINLSNFYKEIIHYDEQGAETSRELLAPPHNYVTSDGRTIINFHLNPTVMIAEGWREWTDEELAAWHASYDPEPPAPTVQDYDDVLEAHLKAEREARGYTTREPDYYINSSVARWKQDALDWIAHRDEVMLYGLQVENDYAEGKEVPTLDEFREALPKITWTLELQA